MNLTAIIPVYNEEKTIQQILKKLLLVKAVTEIVVVDDGSTDGTAKKIKTLANKKIKYVYQQNQGKGNAVRKGLNHASGDYMLIQDADLEYDPDNIEALVDPVTKGRAQVIYGSRFLGPHTNLLYWHKVGNNFLNFLVNILYNTTLSDMETCYKLVPTKLMKELNLKANKFDLEPEITCKILKKGHKIFEVPITYVGRDFSEGKKLLGRMALGHYL